MKVLHLISGGETGGSKNHLLSLLEQFNQNEVILGVFQEGILSEEAQKLGLNVILFKQSSRYDFSILKKMKRVIAEEHVSLVHTHGPRANLYAYLLRKQISFKWITTIHSDPTKDFIKGGIKGKFFTWLNMRVLQKIDHFFAVSNRFKEMLTGFGIDSKKIFVIYNGIHFDIPLEEKIKREDIGLQEEDFVVIMVARLHPIKGHSLVFQAVKKLVDEGHKNVRLLLVGDGPIKEELEKEVETLELTNEVRFLGFQQDVHSYLSVADVKLLASYSESFPLVLLEAARAHTPIISTDVGGVKDMIDSPELGWVVPVGDSDAISEAIEEAIQFKPKGQLKQMGESIYERASSRYSVKSLYEETKRIYKELVQK